MNVRLLLLEKVRPGLQNFKTKQMSPSGQEFCYLEELHCSKGGDAYQPGAGD